LSATGVSVEPDGNTNPDLYPGRELDFNLDSNFHHYTKHNNGSIRNASLDEYVPSNGNTDCNSHGYYLIRLCYGYL